VIASEEKLKEVLALSKLQKTKFDTKFLANEVKRIELEAELAKAKEEFEKMKRRGYNPLLAMFYAGLTTTQATKDLLNRRAKTQITESN
jgi:hypothetical protein